MNGVDYRIVVEFIPNCFINLNVIALWFKFDLHFSPISLYGVSCDLAPISIKPSSNIFCRCDLVAPGVTIKLLNLAGTWFLNRI
jgi:hypothetical protein